MSAPVPSTPRSWALLGLAIFAEILAIWAVFFADRDAQSRSGIPLWILGLLLIPFGIWLGYTATRAFRANQ